jgi:hypothetical protein
MLASPPAPRRTPSRPNDRGAPLHRRHRLAVLAVLAAGLLATGVGLVPVAAGGQPAPASTGDPAAAIIVPTTAPVTSPPPTSEPPPTTAPPPPTTTTTTRPPVVSPDPPQVLDPGSGPADCNQGGITRPAGFVPPGYIYTPTLFSGVAVDPQPDDTFVADAPGHTPHTGRLTRRTTAGREEFLVCAHLGTNTPDPALTAFAVAGSGGHPATLTARVVVIAAGGATTSYDLGDPRLSASGVLPYTGSTDRREGFAGGWIPFTDDLREPGFTVRVEVRGTAATPGGGTNLVMGADEVFVHLGPAPQARNQRVTEAVGIAIDDSVIGERPTDPGPDDLSTLFGLELRALLTDRIAGMAPQAIEAGWDWDPGLATLADAASGTIDDAWYLPSAATLDVVPIDVDESRLQVHLAGSVGLDMTIEPHSFGTVSILAGSCGVDASVAISIDLGFTVGVTPDRARPTVSVALVASSVDTTRIHAQGPLLALGVVVPFPLPCSALEDDFAAAIEKRITETFDDLNDGATRDEVQQLIEAKLSPADLATGPLSSAGVTLRGGGGLGWAHGRWVETAPSGQGRIGGAEWIHPQGVDLAAGLAVTDQGGSRFPYSYVPSATASVVRQTHERTRTMRVRRPLELSARARVILGAVTAAGTTDGQLVDTPAEFDLGMVVSGATVNQLLRALAAGGPGRVPTTPLPVAERAMPGRPGLAPPPDVGLLDLTASVDANGDGTDDMDIATRPAVAPLYLPTAPGGWPTTGDLNLFVPSLRVTIPVPQVATMAADIRIGATATIDTATNHLTPSVTAISVQPRFLRLGSTINAMADPAQNPIVQIAGQKLREAIPPRIAGALSPIALPDLKALFATPGFTPALLANLSVRTVGGGHLGVHLDVAPNPAQVVVTTGFDGGGEADPPTSYTVQATPMQFPGTGAYTTSWVVQDAASGAVVYRSPAGGESTLELTLPTAGLQTVIDDPCSGDRSLGVRVTATVRRGAIAATGQAEGGGGWSGQPTRPPHLCGRVDPEG